jgi:hypothetical protein
MTTKHDEAAIVQSQQADGASFNPAPSGGMVLSDGTILLIYVGFLVGWAIAVLTYFSSLKLTQETVRNPEFNPFHVDKIPCKHCKFYSRSPYLKCAVHPTTALTKQAIDCSDYQVQPPEKNSKL